MTSSDGLLYPLVDLLVHKITQKKYIPTYVYIVDEQSTYFSGDGNVSFEEFVNILSKSMSGAGGGSSSAEQEERELRDAFRVFDKHNRGYICASDLRAVLQCLGEDLSEEESEYRST